LRSAAITAFFPLAGDIPGEAEVKVGGLSWRAARTQYADWFAELFALPATPPKSCDHEAAVMFAGFVSVVDWLGSSEDTFHHAVATPVGQPTQTPPEYLKHACAQARDAFTTLGWTGWTPSNTPIPFTTMFPACQPPRPVQQATIALAEELDAPGLVIIEEQMGEGKTEAAAYLADSWTTRFGQNGIYFGLPTQATSNQMFTRIKDFLEQRYPASVVNLQLLHGHAALSAIVQSLKDEYAKRTHLLDFSDIEDTNDGHAHDGGVVAAEWFSSGKKAILAPFGVGTVDQAMLSALQVKHFFVRMYGLTSKTVIIDEVHAYDTYMSEIIERLLVWLGALRVPVILLSATLPSSRRQRLLDAYQRFVASPASPPVETSSNGGEPSPTPYPRINWATPTSRGARAIPVDPARRRTVHLEWVDGRLPAESEAFALGERLQRELADGGCCVVICNTVRRAQQVYTALKPYFPATELDLFHARYLLKVRAKREKRALDQFSKDGRKDGRRPDRAVLVATQVVEQSLDLDFDLMVSDHAPVDLLLQRSGRLHRHAGNVRPANLRAPRLIVILPESFSAPDAPVFDRGSTYVYDEHILLMSWLNLRSRPVLRIPDDIEPLIEATYETTICPPHLSAEAQAAWKDTRDTMQHEHEKDAEEAKNRYIKPPVADLALAEIAAFPKQEEDADLHPKLQALTRLTGPTVAVVCLYGTAERPLLERGGKAISPKATPDTATAKLLLEHSVTLSDTRIVHTLLKQDPPTGWAKSSVLNHHRCLIVDDANTARVGRFVVRLDDELGIVIDEE
jgi:CRISPR-associated endonuclease/helicase Cas3